MVFSSITFLYLFLPIVLCIYYLLPTKFKNAWLFVSSLGFYFFGERLLVSLLLISSVVDYALSWIIELNRDKKTVMRLCLVASICVNVGLLGYFKYVDFFIQNINVLTGMSLPVLNVALPIGISFYTFQTMSYTIDVYRGTAHAQKSFINFGAFVSLFPQLVAGPIVRYTDVEKELNQRKHTLDMFSEGVLRFALGLGKKVLLANNIAQVCKEFASLEQKTVLMHWMCILAYMLQVYLDFSAYSDMAIGIGKILGFKFPENFNYPFISKSISEFWRRWHMTLGGWFRDYIYFPLGGSKVKKPRWVFNLAVVWMVTGLWHGAQWNFVLWGVYFGVLIAIEKLFLLKWLEKTPKVVGHLYVLLTVTISFVIFGYGDATLWNTDTVMFIKNMFGFGGLPLVNIQSLYIIANFAFVFVVCVIASLPMAKNIVLKLEAKNRTWADIIAVLKPVVVVLMMALSTVKLIDGAFNPFLYFRF